jgi:hypothetical protein
MMQESDNMIAEQTIIMAAGLLRDTLKYGCGYQFYDQQFFTRLASRTPMERWLWFVKV